jgi:2-succinyl-6-hydroxy-2,4-cyclohexadiene-1-carboxylate synthase
MGLAVVETPGIPAASRRVILIHGFTQTARSWQPVLDRLDASAATCAVDLPGHGESSDIVADLWDTASLVVDAAGSGVYVGYSLGGRVALHAALRHPQAVDRLIVIGATGGIDDESERRQRREADELLAESIERDGVEAFLDRWLAQPMFAGIPDDRPNRIANTATGLATSLRSTGTGTQTPLWHQLASVGIPTLVMAGERDQKFTALGHRLTEAIGPAATFVPVPGAGHAAHLEQPGFVADAISSWLKP